MGNQKPDHGHHALTSAAVNRLFDSLSETKALGLNREQFFKKLDKAQGFADRSKFAVLPGETMGFGGNTTHPSSIDPKAQAAHSMGDPHKSGQRNLVEIRSFVSGQLFTAYKAHQTGNVEAEWKALGAAIHALQDSYSNAHMFRDSQHPTDPHAPIMGVLNFAWWGSHDTHEEAFDDIPMDGRDLARHSDIAAGLAGFELLKFFVEHLDGTPSDTKAAFDLFVADFYQPGDDIKVFDNVHDRDYQEQRSKHFENERSHDFEPNHPPETSHPVQSNPDDNASFQPQQYGPNIDDLSASIPYSMADDNTASSPILDHHVDNGLQSLIPDHQDNGASQTLMPDHHDDGGQSLAPDHSGDSQSPAPVHNDDSGNQSLVSDHSGNDQSLAPAHHDDTGDQSLVPEHHDDGGSQSLAPDHSIDNQSLVSDHSSNQSGHETANAAPHDDQTYAE